VVEVDVGDDGQRAARFDVAQRRGGLRIGHGHPRDLAAFSSQLIDLRERCVHVTRVRDGHGLDRHRRVPADDDTSHVDLARLGANHASLFLDGRP